MIRAVGPQDRAAWTALWTAYLAFYDTILPPVVFDATWARLLDPAAPIFGALSLVGGRPVGLVHYIYHATAWAVSDTCYLQDLFVSPEVRGGGHGRALIEHVAAEAKAHGAVRVYWHTNENNVAARRLYDGIAKYSGFIQYQRLLT